MSSPLIANLEKLIGTPRDGALLRFSLGHEHLKGNETAKAAARFREAVSLDPNYSAAWKQLGHALLANQEPAEAIAAWQQGIEVAGRRGDKQAAREMTVFLNRTQKQMENPSRSQG